VKLTSRQRHVGEILPPWYYGLAYEDFAQAYQIFYPIPFNYIIRGFMRGRYFWDRMRSRPTWFDKQIEVERNRFAKQGHDYYREEMREMGKLMMYALKSSTGELTSADFHPERAKEALGRLQEIMRWVERGRVTGWTGPT